MGQGGLFGPFTLQTGVRKFFLWWSLPGYVGITLQDANGGYVTSLLNQAVLSSDTTSHQTEVDYTITQAGTYYINVQASGDTLWVWGVDPVNPPQLPSSSGGTTNTGTSTASPSPTPTPSASYEPQIDQINQVQPVLFDHPTYVELDTTFTDTVHDAGISFLNSPWTMHYELYSLSTANGQQAPGTLIGENDVTSNRFDTVYQIPITDRELVKGTVWFKWNVTLANGKTFSGNGPQANRTDYLGFVPY